MISIVYFPLLIWVSPSFFLVSWPNGVLNPPSSSAPQFTEAMHPFVCLFVSNISLPILIILILDFLDPLRCKS